MAKVEEKRKSLKEVLIDEFLKNENLLLRYAYSEYLPRKLNEYPEGLKNKGKSVLEIIKKERLPKKRRATFPEFVDIWKRAIDDPELSELFFDELRWRKREEDPDKALHEYYRIIKDFMPPSCRIKR